MTSHADAITATGEVRVAQTNHISIYVEGTTDWRKSKMTKIVQQWLLFEYAGLEFTPLAKPFKMKKTGGEGA